jgi:hypothetical protein
MTLGKPAPVAQQRNCNLETTYLCLLLQGVWTILE